MSGVEEISEAELMRRSRILAQRDDAYRAVGRYFVEFSRLIMHMRQAMARRLQHPNDPPLLSEVVIGETTAGPVIDSFFATCKMLNPLDGAEEKVCTNLRNQVIDANKMRNNFAHGDWWIGWAAGDAFDMEDPTFQRIKPGRKVDVAQQSPLPTAEIDALSDDLARLRNLVGEFGAICIGEPPIYRLGQQEPVRVSGILIAKGKGVVRDGPKATGRVNFP